MRTTAATSSVDPGRTTASGRTGVGGQSLVVGVVVADRGAELDMSGASTPSSRASRSAMRPV